MRFRPTSAALTLILLAGCARVVPPPAPPPAPVPVPRPVAPPPPPEPLSSDWRDWPVTPGGWSYARSGGGSAASFGSGASAFAIRCAAGQLRFERASAPAAPLTIRTSTSLRTLAAGTSLPASDSLIDAIGFSRGRFIVQTPGQPPLVIPAWPETLRVAEDCRN